MKLTSVWTLSVLLCLATGAFGSVLDKRAGGKAVPEQTQAQVAEQQKLQGTFGEVGIVEKDTEPDRYEKGGSDPAAAAMMAGVSGDPTATRNDPDAAAAVAQAGAGLRGGGGGTASKIGWGLLLLGLGFCSVLGLRQWVVKSMPQPASPSRVEW